VIYVNTKVIDVKIAQSVVDQMLTHAREAAPKECCGLLIGRRDSVERCVRTRNLAESPSRYLVDPEEHFAAIHDARLQGQRVVGAYHSHPVTEAVPSETDIAEAAGGSEFLYLIVSLANGENGTDVRAYRLRNGTVKPVPLTVVTQS
jgi:proteasome lid subunit RPN8/RPN11